MTSTYLAIASGPTCGKGSNSSFSKVLVVPWGTEEDLWFVVDEKLICGNVDKELDGRDVDEKLNERDVDEASLFLA